MKHWLIHHPDGDRQVCTEDNAQIGEADNPDGHPVTAVPRPGHWHESWDRQRGAWVSSASADDIARAEWESELMTMSRLEFYRLIEAMLDEKIAALQR